jgi:hypothetical protein
VTKKNKWQVIPKSLPPMKGSKNILKKSKSQGDDMNQPKQMPMQPMQQQINIKLDEKIGEGVYANFFMISNTQSETVLDCGRIMPGMPDVKINSRIITTPQHAKQLLKTLEQNIQQYEKQFGEIKLPQMPQMENKNIGFQGVQG